MADDDDPGSDSSQTGLKGGITWIKNHKLPSFLIAAGLVVGIIILKNRSSSSTASTTPAADTSNATIGTDIGGTGTLQPGGWQGGGGGGGGLQTEIEGLESDITSLNTALDNLPSGAGPAPSSPAPTAGQNTSLQTAIVNGISYYWYGAPQSASAPYGTDINGVPLSGPSAWIQGSPPGSAAGSQPTPGQNNSTQTTTV